MSDAANRIVRKLWSYCHVLRDDCLSYQDYLEQLTFLLFLKMADEHARLTGEEQAIPEGHRWTHLAAPWLTSRDATGGCLGFRPKVNFFTLVQ